MLTIWGRTNSINVQKVLWACAELKLAYDRIDAGLQFGVNNTPEFRRMNPNGLVPLIRDGDLILWESHAIVRYLARKHGLGTLCPADAQVAADADRWMDWVATTVWPPTRTVFWGLVRTPPEKRNLAEIEAAAVKLGETLAILDAHLADRPWVAGEAFTMGDIPIGCIVQRWFNVDIKRPKLANVEAYYQRLQGRPAFKDRVDILPLT
jgi:glutathione S-transferase